MDYLSLTVGVYWFNGKVKQQIGDKRKVYRNYIWSNENLASDTCKGHLFQIIPKQALRPNFK